MDGWWMDENELVIEWMDGEWMVNGMAWHGMIWYGMANGWIGLANGKWMNEWMNGRWDNLEQLLMMMSSVCMYDQWQLEWQMDFSMKIGLKFSWW